GHPPSRGARPGAPVQPARRTGLAARRCGLLRPVVRQGSRPEASRHRLQHRPPGTGPGRPSRPGLRRALGPSRPGRAARTEQRARAGLRRRPVPAGSAAALADRIHGPRPPARKQAGPRAANLSARLYPYTSHSFYVIVLITMMTSIPVEQIWPEEFAQRYRAAGHWQGETFGALLRTRAQRHPEREAVVGGQQRWTYGALDQYASQIAAGLLKAGLRKGDRVLVHLPNIPEFISVIFGLFRAGLLPVYALPAHRITEIEHFANSAPARAYIGVDQHAGFDYLPLVRELRERCPQVEHVFIVGQAQEFTSLAQLQASALDMDVPASAAQPSDVAFLQISGGSTGLSKLIPRTHDDYIYTLRESARIAGLDQTSVFLGALPIAHNFPMSSPGFLGALYAGAKVVLSPAPSPDACFELIEREGVTDTSLVPPLLLLWLEAAGKATARLDSLKVIQVGGAKLNAEAAKRVRPTLGVTLQQVFGMAEGLVNYTRLDDPEDIIINTQGRPISPDDE